MCRFFEAFVGACFRQTKRRTTLLVFQGVPYKKTHPFLSYASKKSASQPAACSSPLPRPSRASAWSWIWRDRLKVLGARCRGSYTCHCPFRKTLTIYASGRKKTNLVSFHDGPLRAMTERMRTWSRWLTRGKLQTPALHRTSTEQSLLAAV